MPRKVKRKTTQPVKRRNIKPLPKMMPPGRKPIKGGRRAPKAVKYISLGALGLGGALAASQGYQWYNTPIYKYL